MSIRLSACPSICPSVCVCSGIVDVNTTSDRLIIEQLEHEITKKDRESEKERQKKKDERQRKSVRTARGR